MRKFKSFIALDLKSNAQNISIVKKLHYHVYGFKVGYRSFYNKRSNDLISEIKKKKSKLFLDLKLHDIPNTVSSAIDSLSIRQLEIDEEQSLLEKYGSKSSGSVLGDILGKALDEDKDPKEE